MPARAGYNLSRPNRWSAPLRSPFIKGFTLSAGDRADLLAFLESLTDVVFTTNPRFSNPWASATTGTPQ
ncbi:MAG: hypothetical protein ABMA15_18770 [Vicinamibacterales bacterium]